MRLYLRPLGRLTLPQFAVALAVVYVAGLCLACGGWTPAPKAEPQAEPVVQPAAQAPAQAQKPAEGNGKKGTGKAVQPAAGWKVYSKADAPRFMTVHGLKIGSRGTYADDRSNMFQVREVLSGNEVLVECGEVSGLTFIRPNRLVFSKVDTSEMYDGQYVRFDDVYIVASPTDLNGRRFLELRRVGTIKPTD